MRLGGYQPDLAAAVRARLRAGLGLGLAAERYPGVVTSGQEWDLTVPADEEELLAALRRHGVRPGQRLHVVVSEESDDAEASTSPAFFASFSGPADLAERSRAMLDAEFPLTTS